MTRFDRTNPARDARRSSAPIILMCLAVMVIGIVGMFASGCAWNKDPNAALVNAADTFANETVGPEYEALVKAGIIAAPDGQGGFQVIQDADEISRTSRLINLQTFRDAVREFTDPAPPSADPPPGE